MARRELPEVNASSMADIAFLLLTFFLIATTLNKDEGIIRMVPDPTQPPPDIKINKRNTLRILVNQMGQIQINGDNAVMSDIKPRVVEFVDNGGGVSDKTGEKCDYCRGKRDPKSSDTPKDAVISLELDKATPYNYFYTVESYIDQAFVELRNQYSKNKFGMGYDELSKKAENKESASPEDVDHLNEVDNAYPKIIAKARLSNTNR